MDFPLGFPARLKPRAEAAVLKACRKFTGPAQMSIRIEAGITAFAGVVIEAVRDGELGVEFAHFALNQFLDDLPANDPLGHGIRGLAFTSHIFLNITEEIRHSKKWQHWMEQLDSLTRGDQKREKVEAPERPTKLTSTILNPRAARRLEKYLLDHGLEVTEFAIKAQTTDRTIRNFRKTGKVRRSILAGIAKAMGLTTEQLLSD